MPPLINTKLMMNLQHILILTASISSASAVSKPQTIEGTPQSHHNISILADYKRYQKAVEAAKQNDDTLPELFLKQSAKSAMAEEVRNEWLISLGRRSLWAQFNRQYAKLSPIGRRQEVQCYAELGNSNYTGLAVKLVKQTDTLPQGCTRLIETAAALGQLNEQAAWYRVRGLIANRQITAARNLAAALGSPFDGNGKGAQEYSLIAVIGSHAKNSTTAADKLESMQESLTAEQSSFAWGILGYIQAQNHNMDTALHYFSRADRNQLSHTQFEWYARAALRLQRWDKLAEIIENMPVKLQNSPTWQYWLGRSYSATSNHDKAKMLYEKAAASGRNFYAILATEELSNRISTENTFTEIPTDVSERIAENNAIRHALTLFAAGLKNNDWAMRRQAQAEWRYATREADEDSMLAAAQLAFNNRFYEMAVSSADRTHKKLNYKLRYISPFKNTTLYYADQTGVDPAWAYGLIRQESRFMDGVESAAGAKGLMQIMPATAREIAPKIGMDSNGLYTTDGNIRMGTWYMAYTKRILYDNEVLATAGYNAGPHRARSWQGSTPMEGAIYAETIPFNETRDYVKKVMTNTAYYASLFKQPHIPLKQRMGVVPARG